MHTPSHLSCVIVMPGAKLSSASSSPNDICFTHDSWSYLGAALGGFIYSVTQEKVITDEQVNIDEKGLSTETLFAVISVTDLSSGSERNSLIDCIGDGGWEDVKNALSVLYETAKGWLPADAGTPKDGNEALPLDFPISFIALWEDHGSTDWETGFWELDSIEYVGEGKVIPRAE